MRLTKVCGLIASALVLLVATSCTPPPAPSTTATAAVAEATPLEPTGDPSAPMLDATGIEREYELAIRVLEDTLPADATFPPRPAGVDEADAQFESGYGHAYAAFVWQCAWLVEYGASSTESARAAALDRLSSWTELQSVRSRIDEASRAAWAERVVEPAERGDDQVLLELARGCHNEP